jgi:hypothetical protein
MKVSKRVRRVLRGLSRWTFVRGDMLKRLRLLPDNSVDSVVTDPPYHLTTGKQGSGGFMGKSWDGGAVAFVPDTWREVLRVLKPGGHALVFGGTRTFHRLGVALEDAGFEIRDCLSYMHGKGFPKSMNVSIAIDKAKGVKRKVVGTRRLTGTARIKGKAAYGGTSGRADEAYAEASVINDTLEITAPGSPEAERWSGWGTALKPSFEPVFLVRKPLGEKTVAANVLRYGTGAINVDGTRIGAEPPSPRNSPKKSIKGGKFHAGADAPNEMSHYNPTKGRWPANTILVHTEDCRRCGTRKVKGKAGGSGTPPLRFDGQNARPFHKNAKPRVVKAGKAQKIPVWECAPDCPVRLLDEQVGVRASGTNAVRRAAGSGYAPNAYGTESRPAGTPCVSYGDKGSVSRFFYTSKASRRERSLGLPEGVVNNHPTVKPTSLMRWLCRLITPPGGVVLDPFTGSGSTGVAAVTEGFRFVGIDLCDDPKVDCRTIARARIRYAVQQAVGSKKLRT